mmetsp:Transcript_1184/g.2829  ORF Transcript_1184/g.2829 Transcript_1184/m.2829 type:complete len:112 (-) Transcript_1184:436-771(-)|eukprot:676004-Pelagomonas_calceolata.AAC.2
MQLCPQLHGCLFHSRHGINGWTVATCANLPLKGGSVAIVRYREAHSGKAAARASCGHMSAACDSAATVQGVSGAFREQLHRVHELFVQVGAHVLSTLGGCSTDKIGLCCKK